MVKDHTYFRKQDMPNTNLSDPYISLLPMSIGYHKMITSPNNKEIFIIGGDLDDDTSTNKILKAVAPSSINLINPDAFSFKEIPTKLKYGRDGHVALPISLDIVKQICQSTN